MIPELCAARRGVSRLSVLSAGCSTGEEAYTLAMILSRSEALRGWALKVTGVDISRRVLSFARHAVYGPSSFRGDDAAWGGCFETTAEGGRRVRAEFRALCHFRQQNLVDGDALGELGPFDAIFCRNVLMYMDGGARRRVVEGFYRALSPGGFLLLGHSESLLNLATPFELVQLHQDLVYRRSP
ncbi:MAG: CheR family methyltransferase [Nannocystaceae bacterium]